MSQETAIVTKENPEKLRQALMQIDCAHTEIIDGRSWRVSFRENLVLISLADCAPAPTFLAIIDGGTIYANKVARMVAETLKDQKVKFTMKENITLPRRISKIVQKACG